MKSRLILLFGALIVLAATIGCSKEEEAPPPTPSNAGNAPVFGEGKSQAAAPVQQNSGFTQ